MELNWKCPFSPFTYPITSKVGFWYFRSLYIKKTVSNKTYQIFRDKRLLKPGSKYPIWQGSQPISYQIEFSQRDNIYLVDLKYNITYQNIRGRKATVGPIIMPWKSKMTKKVPNNLHGWAFYKIVKFVLRKKVYQ